VEQEGSSTRPQSTEELLRDHAKGLEAGLQELAVTGRAFTVLRRSEAMDRLLYFTRIYARFTPADKVTIAEYQFIKLLVYSNIWL
jgi:magnesium-transporting ATPase (P-type)